MFSIEMGYTLIAVFIAVAGLMTIINANDYPSYDAIQGMKVAHDMGQDNTSLPPGMPYYTLTEEGCEADDTAAAYGVYDYGAGSTETKGTPAGVCVHV